jgi:major membrane immunogen (membrane-anchored lipoprotein)
MKKTGIIVVLICISVAVLGAQTLRDGLYFAQSNFVQGVKNQVVLQVQGGKITSADWNGITYSLGVPDRKTYAASGKDTSGWAAQAKKAEDFLVSSQNTNAAAIDGVTIPVAPFFTLVKAALGGQPVAKGTFKKDGWFYAEASGVDGYHTKNTALITVVNGTIVDALWNGGLDYPAFAGQSKQNISRSNNGTGYPMSGAKAAWHVQADNFTQALVKAGDTSKIAIKGDGKVDAVSGVSIIVKEYVDVVNRALQGAR